jgi:light-regulated signal transduction histidine kinase (bacteriophytochrome)
MLKNKDFRLLNLPQTSEICDYWHLSFQDNGIGFEAEYNQNIFVIFQRLHHTEDYLGTGIGLAIVKKIVENHNGIIIADGNLNNGVTFNIYIPVTKDSNNENSGLKFNTENSGTTTLKQKNAFEIH